MSGQLLRGASTRIVTYPIRVLIIINSVLFPILLGIIIYLILQFKKPIMDVIDKAKHIEHIIETNIHLGINKVKEIYKHPEESLSVRNIGEKLEKIKDGLSTHITTCINHIIYIQTYMTLKELKKELKGRALDNKGNDKEEMIKRLMEDDEESDSDLSDSDSDSEVE